jgi:hypothetical protein
MSLAERLTPAIVEAAQTTFDAEDRAVVAGSVVASLGFTAASVGLLSPNEWEDVADYLTGLLARDPVASSRAWAGHRIVLGSLASELRTYAYTAGQQMVGTPKTASAFDDHITDVIAEHRRQREPDQPESITPPDAPHDAP